MSAICSDLPQRPARSWARVAKSMAQKCIPSQRQYSTVGKTLYWTRPSGRIWPRHFADAEGRARGTIMMQRRALFAFTFAFFALFLRPRPLLAQAADKPPLKPEELDQILAPIALYPDSLLSQILMAAGYPLE